MPDHARRDLLRVGALGAGTLLAGCTGQPTTETPEMPDAGDDTTATATTASPYSVEMAPVGRVSFETPPEQWVAYFSTYGDMGIALGQADGLAGLFIRDNYPTEFYDELGLDIDLTSVPALYGGEVDREPFYEADADVHLLDPNMLTNWFDWGEDDVADITENVGPFVGNMIRRRGDAWHDYQYYTLYEAFEKVASVFQQGERYDRIRALHDEAMVAVDEALPQTRERPEIALLSVNSDFETGSFWAYPVDEAAGKKQYRDLGVRDAFADHRGEGALQVDYETLLDRDPDALVFHFGVSHTTEAEFEARMETMREDSAGSQLSAVQNDRLFRGGTPYQGPIINLFQTELAGSQLYPDALPTELFDREELASIITG